MCYVCARSTNKKDLDYVKLGHARGGKTPGKKGFANDKKLASQAGRLGGAKSRRGKAMAA